MFLTTFSLKCEISQLLINNILQFLVSAEIIYWLTIKFLSWEISSTVIRSFGTSESMSTHFVTHNHYIICCHLKSEWLNSVESMSTIITLIHLQASTSPSSTSQRKRLRSPPSPTETTPLNSSTPTCSLETVCAELNVLKRSNAALHFEMQSIKEMQRELLTIVRSHEGMESSVTTFKLIEMKEDFDDLLKSLLDSSTRQKEFVRISF